MWYLAGHDVLMVLWGGAALSERALTAPSHRGSPDTTGSRHDCAVLSAADE